MLKPVKIDIKVPTSKSITQRALLANFLSGNKGKIINALISEDTKYLQAALKKRLRGKIYLGNNGTALRFLLPHCQPGAVIDGNQHLRKRPINDLIKALEQLGYVIQSNKGYLPVKIISNKITNLEVAIDASLSSQFLSSLMFLNPITIKTKGKIVSKPYIDLTINILKQYGIKVQNKNYKIFKIKKQKYKKNNIKIEADASSASYWLTYNFISDSKININNLNLKSKQGDIKYIKALEQLKMGKIIFDFNNMPDCVMSLAVAAIFTNKKITIKNIANLRIKETDRLKALHYNLNKLGIKNKIGLNYITISGTGGKLKQAKIKTFDDHRIAMAFGIIGLKVDKPSCVKKSYPDFWKDYKKIQDANVVLTGMRAAGKTRNGKRIAKELKMKFIDLDQKIEKHAKQKIANIVEQKGWKYFRNLEYKICKKYSKTKNTVIATGGGTMMYKRNYDLLKNNYIILVNTSLNKIQKRIARKIKKRPTLQGQDPISEIKDIWKKRRKKYLAIADKQIRT